MEFSQGSSSEGDGGWVVACHESFPGVTSYFSGGVRSASTSKCTHGGGAPSGAGGTPGTPSATVPVAADVVAVCRCGVTAVDGDPGAPPPDGVAGWLAAAACAAACAACLS